MKYLITKKLPKIHKNKMTKFGTIFTLVPFQLFSTKATELILPQNINSGPADFLQAYLQNAGIWNNIRSSSYDNLLNHGCYCQLFNPNLETQEKKFLGGHASQVDEMDELCHQWLLGRQCSKKFLGGDCYQQDLYDYEYGLKINDVDGEIECLTESPDDGRSYNNCEIQTCIIDKYYVETIGAFINDTFGGSFEALAGDGCVKDLTSVGRPSSGTASTSVEGEKKQGIEKRCEGEAPFLRIEKVPAFIPVI